MIYAIDTETTGLNPHLGDRAFLITWCDEEGKTGYVRWGIDDASWLSLECWNSENSFIGHNLGFDLAFLNKMGIKISGPLHDTMIAAHIYNPLEESKKLKKLAFKYLKRENKEEQRLIEWFESHGMKAEKKREYIKVPEDIILPYAIADVEMTMALWKYYRSLGVIADPVYRFECSLIPVCVDIVKQGMKVDKNFAKIEAERTTTRAVELSAAGKELGVENLGSDDQIFDALKASGIKDLALTDKGNPKLDDITIQKYDHPLVPLVREFREVTKMNSTYLQPMLHQTDKEDRIHASLNQTGARTGRFSSSGPNLQNIPRSGGIVDVRRGFICRSPKHRLLLIDLSQIELRVLAHYCQEPLMVETLKARTGDLHAATAQELFGKTEKRLRTIAKTLNFAIIYGAGAERIVDTLKQELPDFPVTVPQAKEFKRLYFERFPKVREFQWKVEGLVKERAAKSRTGIGYVSGLSGRKYFCEADASYKILNYLIQGESAMFFKRKMKEVFSFLEQRTTKQTNVIHDEFIFDIHEDELIIVPQLVSIIEDSTTFRVPIYANSAISSTNWAEKKSI